MVGHADTLLMRTWVRMGKASLLVNAQSAARLCYERAASLYPDTLIATHPLTALGRLLYVQEAHAEALVVWERLTAIVATAPDETRDPVGRARGWALLALGRPADALAAFTDRGRRIEVHGIAIALRALGQPDEARVVFEDMRPKWNCGFGSSAAFLTKAAFSESSDRARYLGLTRAEPVEPIPHMEALNARPGGRLTCINRSCACRCAAVGLAAALFDGEYVEAERRARALLVELALPDAFMYELLWEIRAVTHHFVLDARSAALLATVLRVCEGFGPLSELAAVLDPSLLPSS